MYPHGVQGLFWHLLFPCCVFTEKGLRGKERQAQLRKHCTPLWWAGASHSCVQGSTCAAYITLGRCVVQIVNNFTVCYSAAGGTLGTYFLDLLLVSAHFPSLIIQISSQFPLSWFQLWTYLFHPLEYCREESWIKMEEMCVWLSAFTAEGNENPIIINGWTAGCPWHSCVIAN